MRVARRRDPRSGEMAERLTVSSGDILVLVGTTKGAFLFRTDPGLRRTEVSGPHFPGEAIYALADDEHPEVVYAGVEPAALFRSGDGGETYELVRGLWDHPHRTRWEPGGGGLCLHTVLVDPDDPDRIWVAISTGGVYHSEDGGKSWRTRHQGVRAQFLPDPHPEFGQCVHKVAPAAGRPQRMYLQNHWGLYRTDDAGEQWVDIANGVPSDFGFPMVAHPSDPDTAWCIPLTSDGFRCTAEGRARVFRTRDAGDSWEPLTGGLPQEWAFLTVLRDGFGNDGGDPVGLYFGTRTGELFGSAAAAEAATRPACSSGPRPCVKAAARTRPIC